MISDPKLVQYACIAHHHHCESSDTMILAEYNSGDSSLKDIAHQCLHRAPPHHSVFSHTYRNQAYTFLLDDPFILFGIFEANLPKPDQIWFLDRLKEALHHLIKGNPDTKFTSYCFQGEIHPIFHKLLATNFDLDALHLVPTDLYSVDTPPSGMGSSKGGKILSIPLLASSKIVKGHKKKRFCGDGVVERKEVSMDGKGGLLGNHNVCELKSKDIICQNGVSLIDAGGVVGRHKAKKIWRRHVWVVLVLDLAVCLILFGIWLFVCRGFQCIGG